MELIGGVYSEFNKHYQKLEQTLKIAFGGMCILLLDTNRCLAFFVEITGGILSYRRGKIGF